MSKTFAARPAVKTNGRGVNSSKTTSSDNVSRRGNGRLIDNSRSPPDNSSRSSNIGRGRGRGAGPATVTARGKGLYSKSTTNSRMQSNPIDEFQNPGFGASPHQRQRPEFSDRDREAECQQGQHVGGFTKFEPNTRRRQQVSEMARKESEEYERYKQQNSMKYCNYVGTTGGGEMTEDMVRRKQANDVRNQKFNRLQNQQKRREEKRDAEQREIDLKRAEARKKADENANHYRAARAEDIRQKREEFLRQFENQSKTVPASVAKISTNTSASSSSAVKAKPKPPQPSPLRPSHQDIDRFSLPQPHSTVMKAEYEDNDEHLDDKKFDVEDFPEDVMTLAAMFPEINLTYLNSLYRDVGSVDAVLDIIGV